MVKWQVFLLLEKGRETPRRKRKHQEGERKEKKIQQEKKKSTPPKFQPVINGSHMKETKFWDDLEELIKSKKGEFI